MAAGLAAAGAADDAPPGAARAKPVPVYSVDVYDPKRDPAADLAATIARASAEKKRILIQLGGDWCGWCRAMSRLFHENEKIAAALAKDFIIMKVNWSRENPNGFFLRDLPPFESFPHFYVLAPDGTVLRSQSSERFEAGSGYSEKAILEFLSL